MSVLRHLWERKPSSLPAATRSAIERAVSMVEPRLKQVRGYPTRYLDPVSVALEYTRTLAGKITGPVELSRAAFVRDALVHALFPSALAIEEALCASPAVRDYLQDAEQGSDAYALMGMRRVETARFGMEADGQLVRHDVRQELVYFTGHTLEHLAPTEQQARQLVAQALFDRLVDRVSERIARRKRRKVMQHEVRDRLATRLRQADGDEKPALKNRLRAQDRKLRALDRMLDLEHYLRDFRAVLRNPQQHLQLEPVRIVMDDMGIRRQDGSRDAGAITFNELSGYDRRHWTVVLVRCDNLHASSLAERLDLAQRRLSF